MPSLKISEMNQDDIIANLHGEIRRYERGLHEIKEYLEASPPRIGDATWVVEALLTR